jgi:uncharacterized protein (DUF983 family)
MANPVVAGKRPVAVDVAERVAATFVVTVLGLASADGLQWTDWTNMKNWQTWATAGLVSAFTLVKSLIALKVGGKSASLAPSVELEPVRDPSRL